MSTAELKTDAPPALVTAEELLRDYASDRCDLLEGRVRFMSPPVFGHGTTESRLARLLGNYVEQQSLGLVVSGDTGFVLSREPDTVLGPDVAFVSRDRLEAIGVPEGYFPEPPALAVEVVSPGDSAEEVDDKARRWLDAGTQMVWVVYAKRQTVTVYRSTDTVKLLFAEDALDGVDVLPGFSIKVAELFADLK